MEVLNHWQSSGQPFETPTCRQAAQGFFKPGFAFPASDQVIAVLLGPMSQSERTERIRIRSLSASSFHHPGHPYLEINRCTPKVLTFRLRGLRRPFSPSFLLLLHSPDSLYASPGSSLCVESGS